MSAPAAPTSGSSSQTDLARRVLIGVALVGFGAALPYVIDRVRHAVRNRRGSSRRRSSADATPLVSRARGMHKMARVHDAPLARKVQAATRQPSTDTLASAAAAAGPPPDAAAVLQLVRYEFPLWKDSAVMRALDDSAFNVRPLTGGSTNTLWLCTLSPEAQRTVLDSSSTSSAGGGDSVDSPPLSLVVRFYGLSLDTLIERSHEAEVADLLSEAGVGARIFWHFQRPSPGRIERFIPGRTLRYDELAREDIAKPLARELAKLHCLQLPPTSKQEAAAAASGGALTAASEPVLFVNLWKYFKVALTARAVAPHFGLDPFDASSDAARGDLFSRDAQCALHAALGMPDVEGAVRSGKWTLESIDALDLTGPAEKLPEFIRENKWYKEIRWLVNLLKNWPETTYAFDDGKGKASSSSSSSSASAAKAKAKAQTRFLNACTALESVGLCHNDLNPGNILYSARDPDATPPLENDSFTLIDFEYAAPNPPSYDLANHLCERSLDYSVRSWPFFQTHHQRTFPSQEELRDVVGFYAKAKRDIMGQSSASASAMSSGSSSDDVYAAEGHLYFSTLSSMLASHLLWSLWAVIQSAGVAPSSEHHPSWQVQAGSGRPFAIPPLAFLEYAEQRMELYTQLKRLWMQHNYVADPEGAGAFSAPPKWQSMESKNDWRMWMEQLDYLHDDMRRVVLTSEQRQQKALREYVQGYADREQDLPWPG